MAEKAEQTVEAVSVEDRIADIFSGQKEQPKEAAEEPEAVQAESQDAEDGEPQAEVSEESDDSVEVEFNGISYQVPKELKDALMRETDYTQKTQALSSQRKEIELQQKELVLARERESFQASVKEETGQLEMLDAYIKHVNQNTDWASMDVNAAFRAKMELDQLKEQKVELERSLSQKYQEFQSGVEKKRSELKAESEAHLSKAIPGWSEKVRGEVQSYIKSLGYPEIGVEHMSSLDYQVAYKAMQFDALKSKTSDAVKKASSAPAIKPTARKEMPKEVQKKLNYRKAVQKASDPSTRSKLAEDRLGDIFAR